MSKTITTAGDTKIDNVAQEQAIVITMNISGGEFYAVAIDDWGNRLRLAQLQEGQNVIVTTGRELVIEATGSPNASYDVTAPNRGFKLALSGSSSGGGDLPGNIAYIDKSNNFTGNNTHGGTETFNGPIVANGNLTAPGNTPSNNASDVINLSTYKWYEGVLARGYHFLPARWDEIKYYGDNGTVENPDLFSRALYRDMGLPKAGMASNALGLFVYSEITGTGKGWGFNLNAYNAFFAQLDIFNQHSTVGIHANSLGAFVYPWPGKDNLSSPGAAGWGLYIKALGYTDNVPKWSLVLYVYNPATDEYTEASTPITVGWNNVMLGWFRHPTKQVLVGACKDLGATALPDKPELDGWTFVQLDITTNLNAGGLMLTNANDPVTAPPNPNSSQCKIRQLHIFNSKWMQPLVDHYNL